MSRIADCLANLVFKEGNSVPENVHVISKNPPNIKDTESLIRCKLRHSSSKGD